MQLTVVVGADWTLHHACSSAVSRVSRMQNPHATSSNNNYANTIRKENLIGTSKRILRIGSIPVNNSSELMVTVFTLYRRYAARATIVQSQPSSLFYQIDYLSTSRSFFVLTFHICHVVRRCINF